MLPNKSNLILLGIGIVAGYFLAAQSLQALDFNGTAVLIDPFFTGNPAFVSDKAAAIKGVSHILLTHGHADHGAHSHVQLIEECGWHSQHDRAADLA